jgi:membrane protein implicated in regulation of membrane protease activity
LTNPNEHRDNSDSILEAENSKVRYAPLLCKARFGPGALAILLTIAIIAVALYMSGLVLFAAISAAVGLLLLGIKSMEIIRLSRPERRELVGRKCVVVKDVRRGMMGAVRLYGSHGRIDPELWSAESERDILAGQDAEIIGVQSIILLITPSGDFAK